MRGKVIEMLRKSWEKDERMGKGNGETRRKNVKG